MTINCKGELLDLSQSKVMGILNLTPDSFYDGGRFIKEKELLHQVEKMLNEGASFIDIGGYSSRPGADDISIDEEKKRVLPVLEVVLKMFPETLISIDTFRSEVATECLEGGAAMVNDISGGSLDERMFEVVAKYQVPYIIMHMRGTPQTMKSMTDYDDLLKEIIYYFSEKIALANQLKINDVIIDPGFGFAKTVEQNYFLLKNLALLKNLDRPILAGLSRKSMLYKTLGISPEGALNSTTAANILALENGANILRVHDVKEAVECIKIHEAYKSSIS
ncbi:dihydropteroate synthase [Croceivirga thetidis]|uniref:Dihydropteroate synthase n=1 Tax=Croceivirga thetidis TaxID=2721623 RepID=A0ABX1GVQ9_9FLAO|nr:dihydropteroate synthase [Croceivirga thetidis]NKI33070.1 dihydropteroate synthase [Croceivirga thetidis]